MASRMISLVVVCSASARASIAGRDSRSIPTWTTSVGPDPCCCRAFADKVESEVGAIPTRVDLVVVKLEKGHPVPKPHHDPAVGVAPKEVDTAFVSDANHEAVDDLVVGDSEDPRNESWQHLFHLPDHYRKERVSLVDVRSDRCWENRRHQFRIDTEVDQETFRKTVCTGNG